MKKIGFIDFYLDEWHANNYPKMLREESNGEMTVSYAYAMIPSPFSGMTTGEWCTKHNVTRCGSIDELTEKSDLLVVLSPDNCEMHEALCQIPLRSGKRCYVDKTFAPDAATARRILAVADAHGTPCYSSSALRFAPEYASIDPTEVVAANCWGPGNFDTYAIHQLEPLIMAMGTPAKRTIASVAKDWYLLTVEFEDGRTGSISGYMQGSPFMMNLCGKTGNRVIKVESDYFGAFISALILFFKTGEIPARHEDTISIMAARAAGIHALRKPGEWVECKES